jgi:hypothetical protein
MSRACSCFGSNENCRWCSGSGYLPDPNEWFQRSGSPLPVPAGSVRFLEREVTMAICPLCHCQLREWKLPKHLKKKCPKVRSERVENGNPNLLNRPANAPAPNEKLSGKPVTRLRSSGNAHLASPSSKPDHANRSERKRTFPEDHDGRQNRKLDGSRDFAQFRDRGQFGSYPSFDSCDDESHP